MGAVGAGGVVGVVGEVARGEGEVLAVAGRAGEEVAEGAEELVARADGAGGFCWCC